MSAFEWTAIIRIRPWISHCTNLIANWTHCSREKALTVAKKTEQWSCITVSAVYLGCQSISWKNNFSYNFWYYFSYEVVSKQVQHWNFGENLTFKWLLAEISRKHHPVRTLERVSVILFCSAFQNILPTSGLLQLLLWKVRVSSLLKSHMTNNLWSPSSISAVVISVFLPGEAIRWLKGISSIMRGLRFIQLPRLKPTRSSEIKARSCKMQETLRYKLCPRTLYWKKNDWERHTDDFMRKWQPSLQRKIMNLINLAFRRDLLYNPGTGTITQNTWE